MRLNEYMVLARRMRNKEMTQATCLAKLNEKQAELILYFMKGKWPEFYDSMGDLLWYLSQLADLSGYTFESVAENNISQLEFRYPMVMINKKEYINHVLTEEKKGQEE